MAVTEKSAGGTTEVQHFVIYCEFCKSPFLTPMFLALKLDQQKKKYTSVCLCLGGLDLGVLCLLRIVDFIETDLCSRYKAQRSPCLILAALNKPLVNELTTKLLHLYSLSHRSQNTCKERQFIISSLVLFFLYIFKYMLKLHSFFGWSLFRCFQL